MIRPASIALAALLLGGCATFHPRPAPEGPGAGAPSAAAAATHEATGDDAGPDEDETGEDATTDAGADAPGAGEDARPGDEREPGARAGDDAEPAPEDPALARARQRILAAARRRLGTRPALDCSGFVLDAYRAAGLGIRLGPGRSRSESLHDASHDVARPRPGDLAFFHDTYDRNHDGRRNDLYTHVALVESVEGDIVTLLHRGARVERIRMNLARPSDPAANGILRIHRLRDAPGTRYLAGELFAAFGELLEGEFTQTLQGGHAIEARARHPAPR
ncbi:NlpC/P60 family protein [Anaeromyxobacter oryzae]|uniref:NlpC/P60 domain-containing protein n=1 Tax=Anaeromyxobacter oryzae TaxID=2918170 RepID=A0ABM7WWW5_9BACT|nr:NlpC/P60 family protein [Anaeromyxobacter oryzae]BDG04013.1 hypothetical protein AMOR_30090 [Anaeromyxobacter oryzae]